MFSVRSYCEEVAQQGGGCLFIVCFFTSLKRKNTKYFLVKNISQIQALWWCGHCFSPIHNYFHMISSYLLLLGEDML